MKTFSNSQQNLLDVLRITPLQPSAGFVSEQHPETLVEPQTQPVEQILQAPDLSKALAQDIQLALPDSVNWQIHSLSDNVALNDKQLLTPTLEKLQQAQSKKALWRLLSALHED